MKRISTCSILPAQICDKDIAWAVFIEPVTPKPNSLKFGHLIIFN